MCRIEREIKGGNLLPREGIFHGEVWKPNTIRVPMLSLSLSLTYWEHGNMEA